MIAIINIDPDLRQTGPHLYEVRINREVVATFVHNREDDLFALFERAAHAVSAIRSPYTNETENDHS